MKVRKKSTYGGFTMLELVAVLALTAVGLVFSTMFIETAVKLTTSNRSAAEDSQKIQAAMNRLVKELSFTSMDTVVISGDGREIQWISNHPDRLGEACSVSWDGGSESDLTIKTGNAPATPLLDKVGLFTVSSTVKSISFTVASSRSLGVSHESTVHPR